MGRGTLSDQQPGVVGGHGRPEPFLLRLSQPCSRHAQPCCEVLCASEALSEGLTSVQILENTRVSLLCPAHWTGSHTFVLRTDHNLWWGRSRTRKSTSTGRSNTRCRARR